MFLKLFLLFTIIPFLEVTLLLKLGSHFGFWSTLVLVILTGLVGAYLVKMEGLAVWTRVQKELAEGRMPTTELVEGLFLLVAGIVLVTPGILTDIFGLCLLYPRSRKFIISGITPYWKVSPSSDSSSQIDDGIQNLQDWQK